VTFLILKVSTVIASGTLIYLRALPAGVEGAGAAAAAAGPLPGRWSSPPDLRLPQAPLKFFHVAPAPADLFPQLPFKFFHPACARFSSSSAKSVYHINFLIIFKRR
jgi:hypothetical protein